MGKAGLVNNKDVERVYSKYVNINNNEIYLGRYSNVIINQVDSINRNYARLVTVKEFERLISEHNIKANKLLMFNGGAEGDPELKYICANKIDRVDYNEKTGKNDLHDLNCQDKDYDFFLFSQTLEHVYNTDLCIRNINNHLTRGGYVFTSVPVINIGHSTPFHYYTGFTPVGLGIMFERGGVEIIEIGQWGNLKYILKMFINKYWPEGKQLNAGFHEITDLKIPFQMYKSGRINDFNNPVDCWILAKKI